MSALYDFQASVVTALGGALGDAVDVAAHPGRFTAAELKRLSMRLPGVRVSVPALKGVQAQGSATLADCRVICILCADNGVVDGRAVTAAERIASMVSLSLRALSGNAFCALAPQAIEADNLFSTDTTNTGAAMWGIGFTSRIVLAEEDDAPALRRILWSLAPEIGPDHLEDYRVLAESEAA